MKVVMFGSGPVACQVARFVIEAGDEIVGVVLSARADGSEKDLVSVAGVGEDRVLDGAAAAARPEIVRAWGADMGVSVFHRFILRQALLECFPKGVVNLHPSLLPYNRGAYPNVWSIIERTPPGATLHHVDLGVDTGDIILQCEVHAEPTDTGASLYDRSCAACLDVFREAWPALRAGTARRTPQRRDVGTTHRLADVQAVDRIELEKHYTGRQLIDILRARTFAPHAGAYFEEDGRRIYVRVDLEEAQGG